MVSHALTSKSIIEHPERKRPLAWSARRLIGAGPTVVVEAQRPPGVLLPSGQGVALEGVQAGV